MVLVLYNNGVGKSYRAHRLIAEHFVDNPNNLPQVNHKDGNKTNNKANNLEWCTCQDNIKHSWKLGLKVITKEIRNQWTQLGKNNAKPILQYDLENNFIREWESASEAGRCLKIPQQSIVACLKGRMKQAGKYLWKYKLKE